MWPETDVTLSGPDSVAEAQVDTFVVQVSARTVSDEEPHGSLSVRLRSSDGTAKAWCGRSSSRSRSHAGARPPRRPDRISRPSERPSGFCRRISRGSRKGAKAATSPRPHRQSRPGRRRRRRAGLLVRRGAVARRVTILDDSLQEDDETFALELTRCLRNRGRCEPPFALELSALLRNSTGQSWTPTRCPGRER